MNLSVSILAWVLLLGVAGLIFRLWKSMAPARGSTWLRIGMAAASLGALLVLMRPHEDWMGGQDGGAYLNLGARFAREKSPLYVDALIPHLDPGAWDAFRYYAHNAAYMTKYGTEWVHDAHTGVTGPWFQPAFPWLISLPARIGFPWATALVVPFIAWVNGVLVGLLAFRVSRSGRGAVAASLLYWFNPLILWHGRAPRPEFIASFFLLAGVLFLGSVTGKTGSSRTRLLYGTAAAFCFSWAPFFHITAWNAALPAAVVAAVLLVRGERALAFYPACAAAGLALFCAQVWFWSDTYGLGRRFIEPFFSSPASMPVMVLGVVSVLAGPVLLRKLRPPARYSEGARSRAARGVGMALLAAFFLGMAVWARRTRPTPDLHYVQSFVYRTDVVVAADMVSAGLAVFGAFGWLALAAARERSAARQAGIALAVLLPPAFLVGNMYDFFMTRYLVSAWVPLLVLGAAAWIVKLSGWAPPRMAGAAAFFCTAALLAGSLLPRVHWITTREYRGYFNTAREVARPVQESGGMLLVEYSRLGSIFDHVFGLPTLALNNERLDDRLQDVAEEAWATLMRRFPDRPAYLLTAYPSPASERFSLERMMARELKSEILLTRRWSRPPGRRPWHMGFYLYRMRDRETHSEPPREDPYVREMDAGRFGVRGFALPQYRAWHVLSLPDAGAPGRYALPEHLASDAETRFVLHVFYHSETNGPAPRLQAGAFTQPLSSFPLASGWRWAHGALPRHAELPEEALSLRFDRDVLLNAVWLETEKGVQRVRPDARDLADPVLAPLPAFAGRAGTGEASLTWPPMAGPGTTALFLLLPEEVGTMAAFRVESQAGVRSADLPTGRWIWTLWSGLTSSHDASTFYFSLEGAGVDVLPFHVMIGAVAAFPAPDGPSAGLPKRTGEAPFAGERDR